MVTYPERTATIQAALERRYGGLSADAVDTNQSLAERVYAEAVVSGHSPINRIPSTFVRSDADTFESIPQYRFPEWRSLDRHYEFFAPEGGVLLLAPSLWQFILPFHLLSRTHGLFVAYETPANVPLAAEIVRQARTSVVVTHVHDIAPLRAELERRNIRDIIKTVVAIAGVDNLPFDTEAPVLSGATTLLDLHLFPGHSIAYQSFPLVGFANVFHLDTRYLWEFDDDGTYITGIDESVLPVFRYRLPFTCTPTETLSREPTFTLTSC